MTSFSIYSQRKNTFRTWTAQTNTAGEIIASMPGELNRLRTRMQRPREYAAVGTLNNCP